MKVYIYIHATNNHWALTLRSPSHGKIREERGTHPYLTDKALIYATIIYALTLLKHPKETEIKIFGITDLDFPDYKKISQNECPEMIRTVYNAH